MIEFFSWICTAIAIYGTFLNAKKDVSGFYFWLVSNTAFCAINFFNACYAQAFLFAVYICLAIVGIKQWRDDKKTTRDH